MPGTLASRHNIPASVPQRSVLGPLLYSMFTHDVPGYPQTILGLFSDDTATMATSLSPQISVCRIQTSLDSFHNWLSTWRWTINPNKTQSILFCNRLNLPRTQWNLEWKHHAKCLGITFDRRLTWAHHTTVMKQRGLLAIKELCSQLKCASLSLPLKCQSYTTITIRSAVTYGIPIWGYIVTSNLRQVQVILNKVLRIITKEPCYVTNLKLFTDLNIP